MLVAALLATVSGGFLVSGDAGAATVVVAWTAVLIACWRLRARNAQDLLPPAKQPQPSAYADIGDFTDCLDDLARERNWDPDKRFEIARMACEYRTMTFDELEHHYDRGLRSAPDRSRQGAPEAPKRDGSI